MNKLAAFKATLVAATVPAFIVCIVFWPLETAQAFFTTALVILIVVLWGVAYENFKRRNTR